MAFAGGWLASQVIKIFTEWVSLGKISGKEVFALLVKSRSGGMPSGHAASFGALTTFLGLLLGFNSGVFVLAVGMFFIVAFDAVNVRRSVGEMGGVMAKEGKIKRVVKGHTLLEVMAGMVLGVIVGMVVFVLMS